MLLICILPLRKEELERKIKQFAVDTFKHIACKVNVFAITRWVTKIRGGGGLQRAALAQIQRVWKLCWIDEHDQTFLARRAN